MTNPNKFIAVTAILVMVPASMFLVFVLLLKLDDALTDREVFLPTEEKRIINKILTTAREDGRVYLSGIVETDWLAACALREYDEPSQVVQRLLGYRTVSTDDELSIMEGLWALVFVMPDGDMAVVNIPRTKLELGADEAFCFTRENAVFNVENKQHFGARQSVTLIPIKPNAS